ncbi:uncharacterized protein LOC111134573 isoform X1 [Crassostrea virginica]|uniref:Uncharacterized protein LOC111134573 isoform X1 n=1 Tax=Crassostrea virginica TaxID=6565 RepID=A0A8B8EJ10_CRAVI|nr:uncharacterized protein LOC111134573 isoform X1 [Crassostrea virginica]
MQRCILVSLSCAFKSLVVGIGSILLGVIIMAACSYFCFRKWRKKKIPVTLMAFRRSQAYEEEVPPTPSSIQTDSVYSFAEPSLLCEGVNPADTLDFTYSKSSDPYIELPNDGGDFKEKSRKWQILDPSRSRTWASSWKERVSNLIEATGTYSKALLKRNSGNILESPDDTCCQEVEDKTTQTPEPTEKLVVSLPPADTDSSYIYARVNK